MTAEVSRETKQRQLLAWLNTFEVFQEKKPLAIGIYEVIVEQLPIAESKKVLRTILAYHCSNIAYIKNIAAGTHRYNLDGTINSTIDKEEKAQAAMRVQGILKDSKRGMVKEIRDNAELGQLLPETEFHAVNYVLKKHPNYGKKTAAGLVGLSVGEPRPGQRCFYLHLADGTKDDISLNKAFGFKNNATANCQANRT